MVSSCRVYASCQLLPLWIVVLHRIAICARSPMVMVSGWSPTMIVGFPSSRVLPICAHQQHHCRRHVPQQQHQQQYQQPGTGIANQRCTRCPVPRNNNYRHVSVLGIRDWNQDTPVTPSSTASTSTTTTETQTPPFSSSVPLEGDERGVIEGPSSTKVPTFLPLATVFQNTNTTTTTRLVTQTTASTSSMIPPPSDTTTTKSAVAPHGVTAVRAQEQQKQQQEQQSQQQQQQQLTTTGTRHDNNRMDSKQPNFAYVLWAFSRPHTIIGSALAIPALHLLAAPSWSAAISIQTISSMVYAMIPACLMNLYITGLNQITDVDIDRVNKPYLPLPAGLIGMRTATVTVLISLLLSLAWSTIVPTAKYNSAGLTLTLWASALLGTVYSVPPFRLKRFPALAAFCIVAVRGAVINAGFFAHAMSAAYGYAGLTVTQCWRLFPKCRYSSTFFGLFGIVIALMKDVPDVRGDRQNNIRTFSVRLGERTIFQAMRSLLTGSFIAVAVQFGHLAWIAARQSLVAATNTVTTAIPLPVLMLIVRRIVTAITALMFAISVQRRAAQVLDPADPSAVYDFYMHLWKLFYGCYLVLPMAQ